MWVRLSFIFFTLFLAECNSVFLCFVPGLHHRGAHCIAEESLSTCQGESPTSLVSTSKRPCTSWTWCSCPFAWHPCQASQCGSEVSCQNRWRDGQQTTALALSDLHEDCKALYAPLCMVRKALARSDGHILSTPAASRRISFSRLRWWCSEQSGSLYWSWAKRSQKTFPQAWERKPWFRTARTCSSSAARTPCSVLSTGQLAGLWADWSIPGATDAAGDAASPCSATTATYAQSSWRCSREHVAPADATDACPCHGNGASCVECQSASAHVSSGTSPTSCSRCSTSDTGDLMDSRSTTCSPEGRSARGAAHPDSGGIKCASPWTCQTSRGRCGSESSQIDLILAHLPSVQCRSMERIYCLISSSGSRHASTDSECPCSACCSPKEIWRIIRGSRQGRSSLHLRRRRCRWDEKCPRCGDANGGNQKNFRWAQQRGQLPTGALRPSRSRRTQIQAASYARSTRSWSSFAFFYVAIHAAFRPGWCEVTEVYSHRGPVAPSGIVPGCFPWLHSTIESTKFQSPWFALQYAEDLAAEVGNSSAIFIDEWVLPRSKNRAHTVRFADEVSIKLIDDHTMRSVQTMVHENWLIQWDRKPWSLDDPRLFPVEHCVSLDECADDLSIMQISVRHELPPPDWTRLPGHIDANPDPNPGLHAQEDFAMLPPADVPGAPDYDAEDASSSSSHTMQAVFIFHLDDPVIHGHIDWTDYFGMMNDAARLLQIDVDRLIALHEISVPLEDVPQEVVPLIAQFEDDLDPGEPSRLPCWLWDAWQCSRSSLSNCAHCWTHRSGYAHASHRSSSFSACRHWPVLWARGQQMPDVSQQATSVDAAGTSLTHCSWWSLTVSHSSITILRRAYKKSSCTTTSSSCRLRCREQHISEVWVFSKPSSFRRDP